MTEILRIIWLAVNGLLVLTIIGIGIDNILPNIKAKNETSKMSEASSFMNVP